MRLNKRKPIGFGALVMVTVLIVVACGSSGSTPTPSTLGLSAEEAEAEYLRTLGSAVSDVNTATDEVGRILSQVYPTKGAVLQAITDTNSVSATRRLQETLSQLTPPARFREDHERLVAFTSEFEADYDTEAALARGDLFQVIVDRKDFLLGYGRAVQQSSLPFCNALAFGDASIVCDTDVPGGEYGVQLRTILNTYLAVEFFPRVTSFPLGLSQEEVFEGLLLINPEIEAVLEAAGARVRALQPPSNYQSDHDVIVRFLEENLETARGITKAARDQDGVAQRAYFTESGAVLCRAVRALSDEIRPILGPHFSSDVPQCGSG